MFCGVEPQKDQTMSKSWKIRKDQEAVSPVIATILMVAITVVLAAVLYVMVSIFAQQQVIRKPVVTFAGVETDNPEPGNFTATWNVAGVSESDTSFTDYRAVVSMDGAPLTVAQTLSPDAIMSFGTVKLIVRDLGGEGRFSGGDSFLVYGMGAGHSWKLSLIWGDDASELQSQSWAIN